VRGRATELPCSARPVIAGGRLDEVLFVGPKAGSMHSSSRWILVSSKLEGGGAVGDLDDRQHQQREPERGGPRGGRRCRP
jgi:hypothetical protein